MADLNPVADPRTVQVAVETKSNGASDAPPPKSTAAHPPSTAEPELQPSTSAATADSWGPDASGPHWITFPPFPTPPAGVQLIPFKDFHPVGIRPATENEPEVDGLGIPTLTLRVHHGMTKKRKAQRVDASGAPTKIPWWEQWLEDENARRLSIPIDASMSRVDRLHQAAYDFKAGRPLQQNVELGQLWDRFRHWVGLISGMQPPAVRKKQNEMQRALAAAAARADADGYDEEEEEPDEMPNARLPRECTINVADVRDAPEPRPAASAAPDMTDEQRQMRREYRREVRDTRMDRFLNDPETCVKTFFSGYYRDRGMMFSEPACTHGPILVLFFVNFLLRNRVFPEMEKDLKKTVVVLEAARLELPQTFVVARAFPDAFGHGCQLLFGQMNRPLVWQPPEGVAFVADAPTAAAGEQPENVQVITTELTMDIDIDNDKDGNMDVDKANAKDATVEQDPHTNPPTEPAAWGPAPSEPADPTTTTTSTTEPASGWGEPNDESAEPHARPWDEPETTAADWGSSPSTSPLAPSLGPTLLPLTHTTGIVELSTRRVRAVVLPAPAPSSPSSAKKMRKGSGSALGQGPGDVPADPNPAEAVERAIEGAFARVTFGPWHEWETYAQADVRRPRLLADSRGAAVVEDSDGNGEGAGAGAGVARAGAHDPCKDEIVVYVEPAAAEKIVVGMGIDATWVQLARVDMSVPIEVDEATFGNPWAGEGTARVPGGPGVPVAPTRIWYMEQVMIVRPSFHTEMVPLPTVVDVFGQDAE